MISELHMFYLSQELLEVNSGALNDRLRKAVKIGKKHIRQCTVGWGSCAVSTSCSSSLVPRPFWEGETAWERG